MRVVCGCVPPKTAQLTSPRQHPLPLPPHQLPTQVADAKHPTVHKELRELVTFRGPVDAVYKAAPEKVSLDAGSGAWMSMRWVAG